MKKFIAIAALSLVMFSMTSAPSSGSATGVVDHFGSTVNVGDVVWYVPENGSASYDATVAGIQTEDGTFTIQRTDGHFAGRTVLYTKGNFAVKPGL